MAHSDASSILPMADWYIFSGSTVVAIPWWWRLHNKEAEFAFDMLLGTETEVVSGPTRQI